MVGWEFRDTGTGAATDGLAGERVARPAAHTSVWPAPEWIMHDTEFSHLVVVSGSVTIEVENGPTERLDDADGVAIPGGTRYRLVDPSDDCELLDVTLPAVFEVCRG